MPHSLSFHFLLIAWAIGLYVVVWQVASPVIHALVALAY